MYCIHHTSLLTNDLLSVKLFPHLTNWSYMRGPTDFLTERLKVLNVLKIKILIKCKITLDFHFISHHFTKWYARLMQMYSIDFCFIFGKSHRKWFSEPNETEWEKYYPKNQILHSSKLNAFKSIWMDVSKQFKSILWQQKKGWVWICCQNKCCTRTHTQHQNSVKNQSILHLNILWVDLLLQQQQQQ